MYLLRLCSICRRVIESRGSGTQSICPNSQCVNTLRYEVEAWTPKSSTKNRLDAFEMWLLLRMFRVPWIAYVSNEQVLKRAMCRLTLRNTIKCRKISYLGRILRERKYSTLSWHLNWEPSRGRKTTDVIDAGHRRLDRHKNDWITVSHGRR